MKKGNLIRNIFGGLFIFLGFSEICIAEIITGIFMILIGISLLPVFYEKTKLNIKCIQIILPILLILLMGMTGLKSTTNNNDNIKLMDINILEESKNIEISELKFNESEMEIDIKENKEIILEILPDDASKENLKLCSSDSQIAILEKEDDEGTENNVRLKIKPISEGNCEIYVKSQNGIESNRIVLKVVDNERIEREKREAEEQAKKEAEEQAKREAEEQAKKEAEEQAKREAEQQAKKQTQSTSGTSSQATSSHQSTTSSSTNSNSNNTHGRSVYRTPKGKRYHFDPDCGGKNSYQTTLDAAISAGLTPCQKCAQ